MDEGSGIFHKLPFTENNLLSFKLFVYRLSEFIGNMFSLSATCLAALYKCFI